MCKDSSLGNHLKSVLVYTAMLMLIITLIIPKDATAQDSLGVSCLGWLSTFHSNDIEIQGNFAYIADPSVDNGGGGLRIVDITDPTNPHEVGSILSQYGAGGIAVYGDYAYLTRGAQGLIVFNISDPSNPQEVGVYNSNEYSHNVYVSENYVFWANGDSGLRIFSSSNPESLVEVGCCSTLYAYDVFVLDNYAYVVDHSSGLRIINISNPEHPLEVGYCITPGFSSDIVVSGGFAYVADWPNSLRIIDVNNPNDPQEVGFYDTPGQLYGVVVSEEYAYLADDNPGLRILNISDPQNPIEEGFYSKFGGDPVAVSLDDDHIYVAALSQFWILNGSDTNVHNNGDSQTPVEFAITSAYPNPFNPTLNVSVALPETGNLKVSVFNIMGQEVATLSNGGQYSAGTHNFIFNADEVTSHSSGVYFVHASVPGKLNRVKKVVLMK
jgi:hypothetical protein